MSIIPQLKKKKDTLQKENDHQNVFQPAPGCSDVMQSPYFANYSIKLNSIP